MLGYSHLLDDERDHIAALKAAGRSIGAIAKAVGRAKSTVSRELRRNAVSVTADPHSNRGCRRRIFPCPRGRHGRRHAKFQASR